MPSPPRLAYDVFLSHNRADKPWVRELAAWLADHEFNGRHLRPWLDEHFLDPGALGSDAELTTAMDRSRVLGLVLSPEALASAWVDIEVRYFTRERAAGDVVAMLLRDCDLPAGLRSPAPIDFRNAADSAGARERLLERLCPAAVVTPGEAREAIDDAFDRAVAADPGGFGAGPTPERDDLLSALVRHDIDDAATEGVAVAGFLRAAERLQALYDGGGAAAYNLKMLLGECLAAALRRSVGYRQVSQRYLDLAERAGGEPILLFVVARAYSKLAELEPRSVDAGVLFRAAAQLNGREASNEVRAIEALFARVLGKLRGRALGELLIKALTERGRSSRVAAAGAISLSYHRSQPVYYLSELERAHQEAGEAAALPAGPPSRRLLGELYSLDLGQDPSVANAVRLAREDIVTAYPGSDFPYGVSWFLRRESVAGEGHRTPFAGTVRKVEARSMVEAAEGVDVSTVACLTEPRVVDALFDGCGALLVMLQEEDSPQCRRLRDRGVPFAMLSPEAMAGLSDGDHVVVEEGAMRILRR
jgi:hypothetical protein